MTTCRRSGVTGRSTPAHSPTWRDHGPAAQMTVPVLISPRIHYHDDASRSGLIYVGYIGKHLPNAHTN